MNRDNASLLDIARAARLVIEFAQGSDKAGFLSDVKTQSAVMHQLLVMGEAVKRLSDQFLEAHSEVPWSQAARMRDKLIHGYDVIDLEEVWQTATTDVPEFLSAVEPFLPRRP
jgi:uncharacterized protein with HEPN domain